MSDQTATYVIRLRADGAQQAGATFEAFGKKADAAVRQPGQAAAYTKQQMQQLNYQVTDIVSGLLTGQSPLTVLLQQGGQLKDMFGGVGGAARALASGIASMINPFTLAAAAVGAVGAVAVAGARDTIALRDALALTGNNAQLTGTTFADLAQRVAEASGTTQGSARELTLAMVSTGKFSGAALETVSIAAGRVAEVSGQTASEVVKDFAGMSSGVADWAAEHNKAWHFVSGAQLEYIRQLEEQGNKEAAMVETGRALITHLAGQQKELSLTEQRWKLLGDAASSAWLAMKGLAGGVTGDGSIQAIQNRLAEWAKASPAYRGTPAAQAEIASLTAQLGALNTGALGASNRAADQLAARAEEEAAVDRRKKLAAVTLQLSGANTEYSKTLKTIQESLKAGDITQERANELLTEAATKYGAGVAAAKAAKAVKLDYYNTSDFMGPMLPSPTGPNIDPDVLRARERAPAEAARLAAELLDQTESLNISLIASDKARGEAQIEQERKTLQGRLDVMAASGADVSAAQDALNAYVLASQRRLTEQLKPEWQRMLEAWSDTTRQMADAYNRTMDRMVNEGESAFVQLMTTGKLNVKGLANAFLEEQARTTYRTLVAPKVSQATGWLLQQMGGGQQGGSSFGSSDWEEQLRSMTDATARQTGQITEQSSLYAVLNERLGGFGNGLVSAAESLLKFVLSMGSGSSGSSLGSFLSSILGGGGGSGAGFSTAGGGTDGFIANPVAGFADGGISTGPMLAMVSEGRYRHEAHIPLPNGRSVPVELNGAGGGGAVVHQTVHYHFAPGVTQADLRVLTERNNKQLRAETLAEATRPGRSLWKAARSA